MDIAMSIRVGLARQKKTQVQLAKQLEVNIPYVNKLCRGVVGVSTARVEELANIFGVSVSEFISWGE